MIKNMKKPGNNKGFTLVEMIISFAILAIVMLTVSVVISTSSNTYSMIATDINLQYESQMAMSQLQEAVIDCNAYIAVSSNSGTLYVFNKTDDTHYEAYKFAKAEASDELYLYKAALETNSFSAADFIFTAGDPMSSYVKSFSAAVSADGMSVTVIITYSSGSKTYNGRQTVALRNHVEDISLNVL